MMKSFKALVTLWLIALAISAGEAAAATTELAAGGLDRPVLVTAPVGDYDRVFIVEQRTAQIKILNLNTGTVNAQPFLDIDPLVVNSGNERGLLGLAFHPDYWNNGYFYLNYNDNSGATVIARYSVLTTDPDLADVNSALILMTIAQPFENHNGGMIAFGYDGYLYIGTGDGGSGDDPGNRAQNVNSLLGKFLRIDVNSTEPPLNYAIPPSNPYAGGTSPLPEIWSIGWRNPWRWSFDRETGDMWVGDVGQGAWEEIDYISVDSPGGENFGWRCREGFHCTGNTCTLGCPSPAFTEPVHDYSHGGSPFRCSVTGGYRYRGCAIPELYGRYLFGDYCSAQIWSVGFDGTQVTDTVEHTGDFAPPAGAIDAISSFGEDAYGELYICDLGGEVFRIVPDEITDCNENGVADACDIQSGSSEDVNNDDIPDECQTIEPLAVSDLTVEPEGDDAVLRWTATGEGSETYTVYRAMEYAPYPGAEWTVIASELPSTPDMSYSDINAIATGSIRFYLVVTVAE